MEKVNNAKRNVNKMVRLAILSALGIVLMLLIRFPLIPAASYLEYEPGDVPVMIGAFMYGPVSGIIMAFIVSVIQAATVSAASGWVGLLMRMISTGTFVVAASLIYKRHHTFKGAIASLVVASLAATVVMIGANLVITPRFWGVPYEAVKASIFPVLIPFNLIKAVGNSVIIMLLYKPLSRFIKQHV